MRTSLPLVIVAFGLLGCDLYGSSECPCPSDYYCCESEGYCVERGQPCSVPPETAPPLDDPAPVGGYPGAVTFSRLLPAPDRQRLGLPDNPTPTPDVVRYRISLDSLHLEERIMPQIACEAPDINPNVRGRPYRYGYASAKTDSDNAVDPGVYAWFGGVAKLDFSENRATVWQAPKGCTASPPVFVADPGRTGEDGGYVLSWAQDPAKQQSSLVVIDAEHMERGPVARAHYPELFGLISHASFH